MIIIRDNIEDILKQIEGPNLRADLIETPRRVERAYNEMFDGYAVDVESLFKTFLQDGTDQIVTMKNIETWSCCEHHMLPFRCLVSVAYLPIEKVIGASKIERLVHAYAHRLQIQERLGKQIADIMMQKLRPQGVAVVIKGEHLCMRCRGVRSSSSQLVTSVMLGQFRLERTLRLEVMSLLGLMGDTE